MSSAALPISPAPPKLLFPYPNKIFGLKYNVVKAPEFSTIVQSSPSGSESRIGQRRNPLWHFTLTYEQLFNNPKTNPAYAIGELDTLMGFYLLQQGQLGEFLFDDPEDDIIINAPLNLVSDSTNSPVTAASVGSSAGSGFAVNDQLLVAGGGGTGALLQVSSIGVGGAITGFTIAAGGSGYVNTTNAALTVLTGSGTGAPTADISSMPLWFSPLQRQMGVYLEDITDINPNIAFAVLVNGVAPPSGSYTLSPSPGLSVSGNSYAGLYLKWAQWAPNTAYALGALLIDPAGHLQKITTAGTSGSAPPAFNDAGSTAADGTATWTDQGVPAVTASFGFYFRVRFESDRQDFEKFLQKLYTIGGAEGRLGSGSVKLVGARPVAGEAAVNMTLPSGPGSVTDGTSRPGQAMAILLPTQPFDVGILDSHVLENLTIITLPGGGGYHTAAGPAGIGLFRGGNSSSLDAASGTVADAVSTYQLPPGVTPAQVTEVWAVIAASKLNRKNGAVVNYFAKFGTPNDDTVNFHPTGGDELICPVVPYGTPNEYAYDIDIRKVAPWSGGYPGNSASSRWTDPTAAAAELPVFSLSGALQQTLWIDLQVFWGGNMYVIIWYTPS